MEISDNYQFVYSFSLKKKMETFKSDSVLLVEETWVPIENHRLAASPGLDINVCPIPMKTDVGQVDLVSRLSDGTSEKIRFPNVPVRQTNLFPLV